MAKIIVIDWGSHHIRLLEGEVRGSRVQVRKLSTLDLPDGHEASESEAARNLVQQALQGYANSGAQVIGLVGRAQAVLRDLRVPNAPPEELPGIIRFQGMRELSFPVEQAAIDYEVLGAPDAEGQLRVILAALQQEVIERYRRPAASLNLELSRLGLRPYATWRAFRQVAGRPEDAVLVVSLAGESLELTVARGDSVLFSRATLLRGAVDSKLASLDTATALVGEVRRTLAAFSNQVAGVEVKRIALASSGEEHKSLLEALSANLSVSAEGFDPFRAVDLDEEVSAAIRKSGGAGGVYVAAIGAAISANEPWPIDFINTKKPVVRRDRRKPMAVLAAAAVVLVLAGSYFLAHLQISHGKKQINELVSRQARLQETLKSASDVLRKYQAVDEWVKSESNALEELRRLTEEYPETKDLYATAVTIARENTTDHAIRIALDGVARQPVPISEFHTKLNRGDYYSAQPVGQVQASGKSGDFRYNFRSQLIVKAPPSEDSTKVDIIGPDTNAAGSSGARKAAPKVGGTPGKKASKL